MYDLTIETWRVTSGWHWRIVAETGIYGCVLKESNFPCVNQEEAELQAQEYIDKEINHADKNLVSNPDSECAWDEPSPVAEGAHLPPDQDFDEIADVTNKADDEPDPGYELPNCYIPGKGWVVR